MLFENLTAIPEMVNIKSHQTESETGGCTVQYSWGPPLNMFAEEISHYLVTFNSTSKRVDNPGDTYYVIEKEQPVDTCTFHTLQIVAVDICGGHSQPRTHNVMNATSV